jgi:hypothetical protein
MKALRLYDPPAEVKVYHLDELPHGSLFRLYGERTRFRFRKGAKNRTRFRCLEVGSGREYMVSGIAEVLPEDFGEDTLAPA